MSPDVSEDCTAPIFRVEKKTMQETKKTAGSIAALLTTCFLFDFDPDDGSTEFLRAQF
jgi:hypothetical protein